MSPAAASARCVLAGACLVLTACSVSRQLVNLNVQGDVPAVDSQGRRAGPRTKGTLSRKLTVGIRCPERVGGDAGPVACQEIAGRRDREVIGGDLGVVASVLPGVQCTDVCPTRISIAPIVAKLGKPPTPEAIARHMSYSSASGNDRLRQDVRRAYDDAVHSRYRQYADYLSGQLSVADWVEVTPPGRVGGTRRYEGGDIVYGVHAALTEIAGSYAALEWARFERGGAPAATGKRAPRGKAGAAPDAPSEDAEVPAEEPDTAEPDAPTAVMEPGPMPAPGDRVDKPETTRTSAETATRADFGCRRSCSLKYRSCLARCRDQPITGGGYDACTYECNGSSLACRGACDAPASP